MSIPITCGPARKDLLFHVLYLADSNHIRALIEESVIDISTEHPFPFVAEALQEVRPTERDSLNKLRARFFLLLGENEPMRHRISQPRPPSVLIAPLDEPKARLFYDELCDELIPNFLQNETMQLSEFVGLLREAYLHS